MEPSDCKMSCRILDIVHLSLSEEVNVTLQKKKT